jgi:hypothetical protein
MRVGKGKEFIPSPPVREPCAAKQKLKLAW